MAKANKIDYAFKAYVLRNHSEPIANYKKAKLHDYAFNTYLNEGIVYKSLYYVQSLAELQEDCMYSGLFREYLEIAKIDKASCNRSSRLRKRIESNKRRYKKTICPQILEDF